MMVGKSNSARRGTPQRREQVALRCQNLSSPGLHEISFEVHSTEIVGVAGMLGSGRELLADALFGALAGVSGEIFVNGRRLRGHRPLDSPRVGMVTVPSDRKRRGILPELSVRESITLSLLGPLWHKWIINRRAEDADVARWMAAVELVSAEPERPVATLSGGNQQKAVLARALRTNPQVLLLDEATQGVDVGAKRNIHDLIRTTAAAEAGVLVCMAESEDLPKLCHHVLVMRDGRTGEELSGDTLSQERIFAACSRSEPFERQITEVH